MRREILTSFKGYVLFLKESGYFALEKSKVIIPDKTSMLMEIADEISVCRKCPLDSSRNKTVPGNGNPDADLVFVGEAPGYNEDRQGLPFVGQAGRLLDRLLSNIGLSREDVFICNVIKCRPPKNRDPRPDEIEMCEDYLVRQLDILQPKVICALGRYAAQTLLRTSTGINRLRGKFQNYHDIPLLPTLHPAAALHNESRLPDIERDFEILKKKLEE